MVTKEEVIRVLCESCKRNTLSQLFCTTNTCPLCVDINNIPDIQMPDMNPPED